MPEGRLTWHRGSVLPYASLWHTVLRACALNALHPADLPTFGTRSTQSVNLLNIHASKIDVAALARTLGEPPAVFDWSTLDALPDPLRVVLAVPRPRVCLACLAAGYHSALFSVACLDACPIHKTPLVSRCRCGAPFDATMRSVADFGMAGSCPCGQMHFFTHETCRRPTMMPDMTQALTPIAAWLHSLSQLIRPLRLDQALSQHAPGCLEWLIKTVQPLGIEYPACLRQNTSAPSHIEIVEYSFPSKLTCSQDRPRSTDAQQDERASRPQTTSAINVYRALARHVRQHIAPGGDRWVSRFMHSCDPFDIGERICCNLNAQRSFVAMLWARSVEPGVEQRCWPYRLSSARSNNMLAEAVAADCQLSGADNGDSGTRHWLVCHAARVSLGARWREAQARTTAAAHLRLARWDNGSPETSWSDSAWLARVTPLTVRFATPNFSTWSAAPRTNKTTRQALHAAHERMRHVAMWTSNRGACLTWSDGNGWYVTESITPANADVRRRRLLGWMDGRPWFYIYQSADGHFVAKWDRAPLQVLGATHREAIAALRRCAIDYQGVCHVTLPIGSQVSTVTPEPIEKQSAVHYHYTVGAARCTEGFWSQARILAEAANKFRRERASWQPSATEQNGE